MIKPFSIVNVSIRLRKALLKGRDYLFKSRTLPVNLGVNGGVLAHLVDVNVYMV